MCHKMYFFLFLLILQEGRKNTSVSGVIFQQTSNGLLKATHCVRLGRKSVSRTQSLL